MKLRLCALAFGIAGVSGCATQTAQSSTAIPVELSAPPALDSVADEVEPLSEPALRSPEIPPRAAYLAGLLPLNTIGVPAFMDRYPTYDGRGVVIAILDTGIDPDLPGFESTTAGLPKILDLRDFSGEGSVPLTEIEAVGGVFVIAGDSIAGAERLGSVATGPYFAGTLAEIGLGVMPASDANGNGTADDVFPIVVGRASDGWVMMTDTDGDGSVSDETAIRDYAVAGQTFSYRPRGVERGPLTMAANLVEREGRPVLDLFFDNQGHGSHVAGIAAGHDMFGVPGFNGVAPGAQLLGLKISNNGRGAASVTGSIVRAMNYAADYAERRGLPLVLNLSFGVGNELEGASAIDSIVNQFALKHPHVLFVSSTGNDGPGLSTLSVPASADFALSVCALYSRPFLELSPETTSPVGEVMTWWSSRGAEISKPDLCAPGIAYSNVPAWRSGNEISHGTSMASPQVAGAAALLSSAMDQEGRVVRGIDLKTALRATAVPVEDVSVLDQGYGIPNVTQAYWWLKAGHQTGIYLIRALSGDVESLTSAAFHREGIPHDTVQTFSITSLNGQPAAKMLLTPDALWLSAPDRVEFHGAPAIVEVAYDADQLHEPGLYVGTVWARSMSDTLAGPMFGLRSVIAVPYDLASGEQLAAGSVRLGEFDRYFLGVPPGAEGRGLSIDLTIERWDRAAIAFLFEPSGQPYRNGHVIEFGDGVSARSLDIPADDVVAGVYEIVVTTLDVEPVTYSVRSEVPQLRVALEPDAPLVIVQNDRPDSVQVEVATRLLGYRQSFDVVSQAGLGAGHDIVLPDWSPVMLIDLTVPHETWGRLADFGGPQQGSQRTMT
ncbi:MAG: S8 family serine peptidase, partial [Gemmatimonadales bacterium]